MTKDTRNADIGLFTNPSVFDVRGSAATTGPLDHHEKIIPLNRVEGDLEIHLELDRDNVVTTARSVGTMYRGIENLMNGRGPLDSLVITPRICGICTTAHLNAAASALDMAYHVDIPAGARHLRNVALMVEQMQNDLRHLFLLFMPDFTRPPYADNPFFDTAVARYQALRGQTAVQTIQATKQLIEIIAILGGQWPHSSFMVPGGVVSVPSSGDIAQCRHILARFRRWYERQVLGCPIERWQDVTTWDELDHWLTEAPAHRDSELGLFIRLARAAGLDHAGLSHDRFISAGGPLLPQTDGDVQPLFPAGVYTPAGFQPLDAEKIGEDVACSFFKACPGHPFDSRTLTDPDSDDPRKYSWAKAPRYDDQPAETGPLADLLMAGHPLFVSWIERQGASVFIRELARMVRAAMLLPAIEKSLAGMAKSSAQFYNDALKTLTAKSYGLITAPRGMLGHWLVIEDGKIANYQVITPTAWNGSPRDRHGVPGPWEKAIEGTVLKDPDDPIEVEQIVRSFDPCLVCTVHTMRMGQ
ncbi:nickel-dependent hydrogenase large subunit [Desulfosarcina cetonica]|uniref:nickel-dependent hydrogenase large subunit n=1 Tax=Desulfosarcina cetonica TaxID=90730 RepID=UPI001FEEB369|nr:nickel-dependent hydrogenase large subunit [Desulfosarcina cetonica]